MSGVHPLSAPTLIDQGRNSRVGPTSVFQAVRLHLVMFRVLLLVEANFDEKPNEFRSIRCLGTQILTVKLLNLTKKIYPPSYLHRITTTTTTNRNAMNKILIATLALRKAH